MATAKNAPSSHRFIKRQKRKHPGIHSKKKSSRNKKSKTYKKRYTGQGR